MADDSDYKQTRSSNRTKLGRMRQEFRDDPRAFAIPQSPRPLEDRVIAMPRLRYTDPNAIITPPQGPRGYFSSLLAPSDMELYARRQLGNEEFRRTLAPRMGIHNRMVFPGDPGQLDPRPYYLDPGTKFPAPNARSGWDVPPMGDLFRTLYAR